MKMGISGASVIFFVLFLTVTSAVPFKREEEHDVGKTRMLGHDKIDKILHNQVAFHQDIKNHLKNYISHIINNQKVLHEGNKEIEKMNEQMLGDIAVIHDKVVDKKDRKYPL